MIKNYTDVINPQKFYTSSQYQRLIALSYWVFTKASCWSYEREVRSFIKNENNQLRISNGNRYYEVGLHESQFRELYFGLDTSQKDIDEIREIISKSGYQISTIKKMKKVKGAFALEAI